jgi:uncharacterized protein with LGFP repeats
VGGRGRLAQFIAKDGSLRQIVWTSTTGAREVSPPISDCWVRVGHANGVLGFPTTDCLVAHDGIGRYQLFERGTIVWHPQTGAFETHGDINAKYAERQGSRFGYPTIDETATSDGRGRFNHFVDVNDGHEKSIYWTPETGAHEVFGLIRRRWASLGWEKSHLGYPTSGEQAWPEGQANSLQQAFQGGRVHVQRLGQRIDDPVFRHPLPSV